MALTLAAALAGPDVAQAIQLSIEYDPQPPFDAGPSSPRRRTWWTTNARRAGSPLLDQP